MKNYHETFLKIAKLFADNSTCCSKKTGCVIVRDGRIISTGFNGVPSGQQHCDRVWMTEEFIDQMIEDVLSSLHTRIRLGVTYEDILSVNNGLIEMRDTHCGFQINRKKLIERLKQKGFKDVFNREDHHKWSLENELHAEQNCLMYAAKNGISTDGADMYMTISPCKTCALLIVQAGIKNVYFETEYDLSKGHEVLRQNNINYTQITLQN